MEDINAVIIYLLLIRFLHSPGKIQGQECLMSAKLTNKRGLWWYCRTSEDEPALEAKSPQGTPYQAFGPYTIEDMVSHLFSREFMRIAMTEIEERVKLGLTGNKMEANPQEETTAQSESTPEQPVQTASA